MGRSPPSIRPTQSSPRDVIGVPQAQTGQSPFLTSLRESGKIADRAGILSRRENASPRTLLTRHSRSAPMPKSPAPVSGELPVSDTLRETLRWATASLRDIYGSRLQRLILFGSQARGEATPESDVDLLVVLDGPINSYEEAKRTSRVATEAAAYRDAALSFVHMSAVEFSNGWRPLVQSVQEEGINLLERFSERSSCENPALDPASNK